jgi:hypothetical protein
MEDRVSRRGGLTLALRFPTRSGVTAHGTDETMQSSRFRRSYMRNTLFSRHSDYHSCPCVVDMSRAFRQPDSREVS